MDGEESRNKRVSVQKNSEDAWGEWGAEHFRGYKMFMKEVN